MLDKHLADLLQAIVAGVGGIIAALLRKESTGVFHTALVGLGAMFLGFIVAKTCRVLGYNEDVSIIATALSGWIGADRTTRIIQSILKRKLGIDSNEETKK